MNDPRVRSPLLGIVGLIGSIPSICLAGNPAYLPSVVNRTRGEFVTPSAEKTATVYAPTGNTLRSFETSNRISGLELSADESIIQILQSDGSSEFFEFATGKPVAASAFVGCRPPENPRFRTNAETNSFAGPLQVFDVATGRCVKTLQEVGGVYPARWTAAGFAEIPVGRLRKAKNDKSAKLGVAVLRFDPCNGTVDELFWLESDLDIAENFAFDPERNYAVVTSGNFNTRVFNLNSDGPPLWISNPSKSSSAGASGGPTISFTFATATIAVMGSLGALAFAILVGRAIVSRIRKGYDDAMDRPGGGRKADYDDSPVNRGRADSARWRR